MLYGIGSADTVMSHGQIKEIISQGITPSLVKGKRVLVLTPDSTRTCPLPTMVRCLQETIGDMAVQLDFIIALGTHTPLSEKQTLELFGITSDQQIKYRNSRFFNHRWDLPDTLTRIGWIEEEEIVELSGGRLQERVPVDINKVIYDYDLILVCGPVFPHEVAGYSGGAKYFFPGISGGEFLHFFHWLGAIVTCFGTIGFKDTPVRQVINRAMKFVDIPVQCLSMVVKSQQELYGLYAGDYKESWSQAADLSEQVHVIEKDRPYQRVFGICPPMYDEIWTGGKVMYKLEQVVADGGELIIYAPHITEVSRTWGWYIEKIGYHIVDYFLEKPTQFIDIPRGVLAHSTHVRGVGSMEGTIEKPRIDVTLATAISPEVCEKINLGYLDPSTVNPKNYRDREDESILYVEKAGEILHRLKK